MRAGLSLLSRMNVPGKLIEMQVKLWGGYVNSNATGKPVRHMMGMNDGCQFYYNLITLYNARVPMLMGMNVRVPKNVPKNVFLCGNNLGPYTLSSFS